MISQRLSSRKTDKKPANFFYAICKSLKNFNSQKQGGLKDFCVNGSNLNDVKKSRNSKLEDKKLKERGKVLKSKKKRNMEAGLTQSLTF
jgi:hypothetical protein